MCSHALCFRFEPVRASLMGAFPSCRRAFGPYPPAGMCRMRRRCFETGRRLRTRAPATAQRQNPPDAPQGFRADCPAPRSPRDAFACLLSAHHESPFLYSGLDPEPISPPTHPSQAWAPDRVRSAELEDGGVGLHLWRDALECPGKFHDMPYGRFAKACGCEAGRLLRVARAHCKGRLVMPGIREPQRQALHRGDRKSVV